MAKCQKINSSSPVVHLDTNHHQIRRFECFDRREKCASSLLSRTIENKDFNQKSFSQYPKSSLGQAIFYSSHYEKIYEPVLTGQGELTLFS